jgi:hypothetical protein
MTQPTPARGQLARPRTFALVPALAALALTVGPAHAVPPLSDDFECVDDPSHGFPPGNNGWNALLGNANLSPNNQSDPWTSDLSPSYYSSGSVSPATDELDPGDFDASLDWYENFLLTGHQSWAIVTVEADMAAEDDDAMGLVARYSNSGSRVRYYSCYMSNHRFPDCNGDGGDTTGGLYLTRVDSNASCGASLGNYRRAQDTGFSYDEDGSVYRMRLAVTAGGLVTCAIDANGDGVFGGSGEPSLTYTDNVPLPGGFVGLVALDMGNADTGNAGDVVFDNFTVVVGDLDNDGDGLSNESEFGAGSNPLNIDTDGDTIRDDHETGMPQFPFDTDGDGTEDHSDTDSDGDGIPDAVEAGDSDVNTLPVDGGGAAATERTEHVEGTDRVWEGAGWVRAHCVSGRLRAASPA